MRPVAEARDGTWTVGDAGEVDFQLRRGELALGDVREYPGWIHTLRQIDEGAIELEFVGSGVTWEFTAHYRRGVLRVAETKSLDLAQPGHYSVGSAGEVEVAVAGSPLARLTPIEAPTAPAGPGQAISPAELGELATDLAVGGGSFGLVTAEVSYPADLAQASGYRAVRRAGDVLEHALLSVTRTDDRVARTDAGQVVLLVAGATQEQLHGVAERAREQLLLGLA
ncbi:MAG: hypothetical protein BRC31_06230, partial [Actinobacteria bacterium QS_5_72_10]